MATIKRNAKKRPNRSPDAILTADLHISESTPVSRTDDYLQAQANKLNFISKLQQKYSCPVLDAGDIFDHWKSSPWLLRFAYDHLPDPFDPLVSGSPAIISVPGNHDLPQHSMNQYRKSSLSFLEAIGIVEVLKLGKVTDTGTLEVFGVPYGQYEQFQQEYPDFDEHVKFKNRVLILHEMIWKGGKPPWPGAEGYSAKQVLKDNPDFDLILTGHNHSDCIEKHEGRILVNPGSMLRISADKADYKPRCYLYYAEENKIFPEYYPIEEDVHDSSHLDQAKERDERMDAYIERMNMKIEIGISFSRNLEAFFLKNKTPAKVKEIIWEQMESK